MVPHRTTATLTVAEPGAPRYPHAGRPAALVAYVADVAPDVADGPVEVLVPEHVAAEVLAGAERVAVSVTAGPFRGVATFETLRRSDGRYAWHLVHQNGNVLATDGGQGYENLSDAWDVGMAVVAGQYALAGADPDPS